MEPHPTVELPPSREASRRSRDRRLRVTLAGMAFLSTLGIMLGCLGAGTPPCTFFGIRPTTAIPIIQEDFADAGIPLEAGTEAFTEAAGLPFVPDLMNEALGVAVEFITKAERQADSCYGGVVECPDSGLARDLSEAVYSYDTPVEFVAIASWGCDEHPLQHFAEEVSNYRSQYIDADGDGYVGWSDCRRHVPGADVLCFRDLDQDGYGNSDVSQYACPCPEGWVEVPGDCDDLDPDVTNRLEEREEGSGDCGRSIDDLPP